jgi:putative transposase
MANTYSQMYIQIVFAVNGRENIIHERFRIELEKYICGISINNKCKPLAIFCNPDHVHLLVGLHPIVSVAKLTGDVKASSSKWLNEKRLIPNRFSWQDGYGSFTYSKTQIDDVIKYILQQPVHHKKKSFKEEYLELLRKNDIKYSDDYLFDWIV